MIVPFTLSQEQISTEIQKIRAVLPSLQECILDKALPIAERNQYAKDHAELSASLLLFLRAQK